MDRETLRIALAVVSGRVTHPTIDACRKLGFTDEDFRILSLGGRPQPPHIDNVKLRCEEIIFNAIAGE